MPADKPIYDFTSPTWAPLHLVVPADQAEMFMWMHGCVWTDGFRLEAYKHRITRLDELGWPRATTPADETARLLAPRRRHPSSRRRRAGRRC